ncbi:unnamed protein product [Linum tenue]|uniref:Pentatricopeptide repeat-containing protein n=3 Tax=Linum tenue TaxID=586396 RepID=A0AAV0RWD8_9ROSI|nr:unnamed protein product [Linum tenue]
MNGYCHAGRLEDAQELLKKICSQGLSPNLATYRTLLANLCNRDYLDKALALFEAMKSNKLKPDVPMYNFIIAGLFEAGRVNEAREMFSTLSEGDCLKPTTRTYNIVINGLCRQGLVDDAYNLFRTMEGVTCPPNCKSYNVIIHGFLQHKGPFEAGDLIQEMLSKGFTADTTTMSLLMDLTSKNQLNHPVVRKLLGDSGMACEEVRPKGLSAERNITPEAC